MATSFKLESMDRARAIVSFATASHDERGVLTSYGPRRRYTVDFANPGLPGAIRAVDEQKNVVTLGSFRIDADTPHPGYMKLRNRVAELRA